MVMSLSGWTCHQMLMIIAEENLAWTDIDKSHTSLKGISTWIFGDGEFVRVRFPNVLIITVGFRCDNNLFENEEKTKTKSWVKTNK